MKKYKQQEDILASKLAHMSAIVQYKTNVCNWKRSRAQSAKMTASKRCIVQEE
jgi:hypothetical protein